MANFDEDIRESQMKSYRMELLIKLLGKRWRME